MHATSVRPAEDNWRSAIEAQPVEVSMTVLSLRADFAHTDLVANHFDRLFAHKGSRGKFSLYSTDIRLPNLSCPDVLLHFSCFLWVSTEEEEAWGETVKAMYGPQIFQAIFFGKYENHCIVAVSTTRMDLEAEIEHKMKIQSDISHFNQYNSLKNETLVLLIHPLKSLNFHSLFNFSVTNLICTKEPFVLQFLLKIKWKTWVII